MLNELILANENERILVGNLVEALTAASHAQDVIASVVTVKPVLLRQVLQGYLGFIHDQRVALCQHVADPKRRFVLIALAGELADQGSTVLDVLAPGDDEPMSVEDIDWSPQVPDDDLVKVGTTIGGAWLPREEV